VLVLRTEFEDEPLSSNDPAQHSDSPSSPTTRNPSSQHSRLSRYLQDLSLRPNESPDDVDDSKFGGSGSGQGVAAAPSYSNLGIHSSAASFSSLSNLAYVGSSQNQRNPETDSFLYIETLLESLSVLGKLGGGLDIVAQRLPGEIFALMDATVDEVSERAEYNRRTSLLFGINTGSKDHSTYIITSKPAVIGGLPLNIPSPLVDTTRAGHGVQISPLQLRLTALESSTKHTDHEILRDLFWTLYSKLDAVMQGLRVVYEVANRIGSVSLIDVYLCAMGRYNMFSHRGVISGTLRGPGLVLCSRCPKFGCLCRLRYAKAGSAIYINDGIP
jgi:exocyst complex component 4